MSKQPTIVFDDDMYDAQFARTLSASYAQMADLGEALRTDTMDDYGDVFVTP